ncbi:hypothetical protein BN946_scf185043.g76 [Trametes cinnabarina]|uniref:HTH CENPB-type domain-containing protein n=1 Tax=Pycnoporus cinnabarinus TaxID=5643 RepID=A0A060SIK1_PYCCI|nr:hypothetical protein BN946_scf185043.g76 [Trametes cinnabarina]
MEEDALCDWIDHLSLEGAPVDKETISEMVQFMTGSDSPPNRKWVYRFLARHPDIHLGRPSGLAPERARAFNRTNVEDYFKQLKNIIDEYGIPWSHVYNMDEKGMQRGGKGKIKRIKYFVPRHRRVNYKLRSSNLELITIIECICADGSSIQPGFIFAGKEFSRDIFRDIDPRVCIALSRTGWTAEYLCLEWFKRCFIPQVNARRVSDAPILLILDSHNSHVTPEMRQAAIENNIHLFLLPPHTTHHLQPLDVGVFAALEHAWQVHCNKFFKTSKGEDMDRGEFIRQYLTVRDTVFNADLICKAWRTAGITTGEFSANAFSEVDYAPSRAFSKLAHVPPTYPTRNPLFPENRQSYSTPSSPSSPIASPCSARPNESQLLGDSPSEVLENDSLESDSDTTPDMCPDLEHPSNFREGHSSPPTSPQSSPSELSAMRCCPSNKPAVNESCSLLNERKRLLNRTRTLQRLRSLSAGHSASTATPADNSDSHRCPRPCKHCHTRLSHLQKQVSDLEDEIMDLYAHYWHAEAHAKLAELYIGDLRKQINYISEKRQRRRRPLRTTALCLTAGEGLAMSQQQEAEEAAKLQQRAAEQARREHMEAQRQQERIRIASDADHCFSGSLARKVKDDLKDIAFALGLSLGGTNAELVNAIVQFLRTHPEYSEKPKFAGLYIAANGLSRFHPVHHAVTVPTRSRHLKRDLPSEIVDENTPPSTPKRPRIADSSTTASPLARWHTTSPPVRPIAVRSICVARHRFMYPENYTPLIKLEISYGVDHVFPPPYRRVHLSGIVGAAPRGLRQIEDKISPFAKETLAKLIKFMEEDVYPAARVAHAQLPTDPATRWKTVIPVLVDLKAKAKQLGLWNLFLSKAHYPQWGVPLTNLEYACMAEILGRWGQIASEAVNCSAPDTGNMEVLARYGSPEQQKKWLVPLLNGEIRSAFSMTERFVASSDATNIRTSIRQEGNEIVINGHKWYISGAGDPRCALHLVLGKSDPNNADKYQQQSIVIVPANHPGVKVIRPMQVFGYDDAPEGHCEVIYENVRVPVENLVYGWGKGFEIIQGRLGPGRIHHCMRSVGAAQYALDLLLQRVTDPAKKTFGKYLYEHGTVIADIAKSRAEIESARLLVLSAALQIDKAKAKGALKEIGIAKFVVPSMACQVIDRAIQSYGAEGVSQDTPLAAMYAGLRTLRIADGPDAVHIQQIGQRELKRAQAVTNRHAEIKKREKVLADKHGVKAHL